MRNRCGAPLPGFAGTNRTRDPESEIGATTAPFLIALDLELVIGKQLLRISAPRNPGVRTGAYWDVGMDTFSVIVLVAAAR